MTAIEAATESNPSKLANRILAAAVVERASEVHVDPAESQVRVRFRCDGLLRDHAVLEKKAQAPLVSELKLLAKLDLVETRRPQTNYADVALEGRQVRLWIHSLPSLWGEKLTAQLLYPAPRAPFTLDKLGMEQDSLELLTGALSSKGGLLLAPGPNRSGKTTTLYAAARHLAKREKCVFTVEDPIQDVVAGAVQIACNPTLGWNFGSVLRQLQLQRPEVILVQELRDRESAELAIRSAVQGTLVLSMLHTCDSAAALVRLLDMGIESYLLAATVVLVQAQRLLRRLCRECRKPWMPSRAELGASGLYELLPLWTDLPEATAPRPLFFKASGCQACKQTGFCGVELVTESLRLTEAVRDAFLSNGSWRSVKEAARLEGLRTLRQSALRKALRGLTSLEEALERTPQDEKREAGR